MISSLDAALYRHHCSVELNIELASFIRISQSPDQGTGSTRKGAELTDSHEPRKRYSRYVELLRCFAYFCLIFVRYYCLFVYLCFIRHCHANFCLCLQKRVNIYPCKDGVLSPAATQKMHGDSRYRRAVWLSCKGTDGRLTARRQYCR